MEVRLRGIGVSPGIAIGPIFLFRRQTLDIPKYKVRDIAAERARFTEAIDSVRRDLRRVFERTEAELGAHHAEIFRAHLMLLDDVAWEEVVKRLESEEQNVEFLVDDLISRYIKIMSELDDPHFRARTDIFQEVGRRILEELLSAQSGNLLQLDSPCVIVAHDLSPSDTAKLNVDHALGIVTDASGPTSHTAILARALEIPAVVGLRHVGSYAAPGDMVVVDGASGTVIIRPEPRTLERYGGEQVRQAALREKLVSEERDEPSLTVDGVAIPTLANVELPSEVAHGLKHKAQGIGLYRTEYIYLTSPTWPTEEEQYKAYSQVAAAMKPHPVVLRTLDIGGDKLLAHVHGTREVNPQLGWRAVRFCLERPDVFKAQLRALLRASVHGEVHIMFPMISSLEELRRVKKMYREVQDDLELRGVPFEKTVKIGVMIEIPSAVSLADALAQECDFFSIGSNDLIQFTLGIDRVNERTAAMYEPAHPAVLRLIRQTVEACERRGIPCSICGEMAGDPLFTEVLLGLGLQSLSMAPVAIPAVRAEISQVVLADAKRFVEGLLEETTATGIRRLMKERHDRRKAANAAGVDRTPAPDPVQAR